MSCHHGTGLYQHQHRDVLFVRLWALSSGSISLTKRRSTRTQASTTLLMSSACFSILKVSMLLCNVYRCTSTVCFSCVDTQNDLTPQTDAQGLRHRIQRTLEVCADVLGSETLRRMKQWFDTCASDHPDCRLGANPGDPLQAVLPKRLIRLDDRFPDRVQLVSVVEPVQYLALSYCWGTSKQRETNKSNLLAREQKIRVAELPRTLQDAITITNSLGFQHIWIDSLCIVQDDGEEWAEQSSKMADIYVGAELVVGATRASDCDEGFLHAREEPLRIVPSDFLYQGLEAMVRRTTTHDLLGGYLLRQQPLFTRAWVMQERELARRIIHFLPDELVWRCRTTMRCECGTSKDANKPISAVLDLCKSAVSKSDDGSDISFGQHWTTLVGVFQTETDIFRRSFARFVRHCSVSPSVRCWELPCWRVGKRHRLPAIMVSSPKCSK